MSEIVYYQSQAAFICSNSAIINNSRIKCNKRGEEVREVKEATDVTLVSLLLTLNKFDLILFFPEFENVKAGWNTLLP